MSLFALSLALSSPAKAGDHDGHHDSHSSSSHDSHHDSRGNHGGHHEDEDDGCPCYDMDDLLTWFDSGDYCYDFDLGTPDAPYNGAYLATYEGAGLAAGAADYFFYPSHFCAVIDLTNTGLIDFAITDEEFEECVELVQEAAEEIGLTCSDTPPGG